MKFFIGSLLQRNNRILQNIKELFILDPEQDNKPDVTVSVLPLYVDFFKTDGITRRDRWFLSRFSKHGTAQVIT